MAMIHVQNRRGSRLVSYLHMKNKLHMWAYVGICGVCGHMWAYVGICGHMWAYTFGNSNTVILMFQTIGPEFKILKSTKTPLKKDRS